MAQHNIIHRDLKPDNILIDDSDPLRPIVKLIDFGSTIYIHSESENYQQEVMESFDPKCNISIYLSKDHQALQYGLQRIPKVMLRLLPA